MHTFTSIIGILLTGCLETSSDGFWEGYLYSQTEDGFVALDNAEIVLLNNLGELIAEGTVPAGRPDSFLQIPLEDQWLNQPVSLRISGTNNSSINITCNRE